MNRASAYKFAYSQFQNDIGGLTERNTVFLFILFPCTESLCNFKEYLYIFKKRLRETLRQRKNKKWRKSSNAIVYQCIYLSVCVCVCVLVCLFSRGESIGEYTIWLLDVHIYMDIHPLKEFKKNLYVEKIRCRKKKENHTRSVDSSSLRCCNTGDGVCFSLFFFSFVFFFVCVCVRQK